jgi:hypothetical protein
VVREFPRASLAHYRIGASVELVPRQFSKRAAFIEAAVGGE